MSIHVVAVADTLAESLQLDRKLAMARLEEGPREEVRVRHQPRMFPMFTVTAAICIRRDLRFRLPSSDIPNDMRDL
jgi:hypothetical protein